MRYFSLNDFQHWVFALALGLVLALSIYMLWGSYSYYRDRKKEAEVAKEGHNAPVSERTEENPIGPFLIFLYVFLLAWALIYWIGRGILGGPIG